ncbi:MAG: OmpA family protein [Pseudomonadota bacterium]
MACTRHMAPYGVRTALGPGVVLFFLSLFPGFFILAPTTVRAADQVYAIHVSSYMGESDAALAVADLKAKGLEAFSRQETVKGRGIWFRVYLGRFDSMGEAEKLAAGLRKQGLISYYSIRPLERPGLDVGAVAASTPERTSEPPPVSEYREEVYGRYVGSFRSKLQAEMEAEGLGQYGWPAIVEKFEVRGLVWYRVFLLPPSAGGTPSGFELLVDLARTATGDLVCPGETKFSVQMALLKYLGVAVPQKKYLAALRSVSGRATRNRADYTELNWGVETFHPDEFNAAVDGLAPSSNMLSFLGWGVAATADELSLMSGRKALIIVSDFKENLEFGDPLGQARALVKKFGRDLCIYTIYVGADEAGVRLARDLAVASGCGDWFDGCLLLADRGCLDSAAKEIFEGVKSPLGSACLDSDRDGVYDNKDECPNTPLGVPVDERGCWIAAWAQFFDFDKSVVKPQYLPYIAKAAGILRTYRNLGVEVAGHTDNRGSDEYNMKLGLRRAQAVKDWLVKYGVEAGRLEVKSYGESQPAASNATDEGRAKNRRVELHVWQPNANRQTVPPPGGVGAVK